MHQNYCKILLLFLYRYAIAPLYNTYLSHTLHDFPLVTLYLLPTSAFRTVPLKQLAFEGQNVNQPRCPPETHYNNCRLVCLSFSSFFNKLAYTCLICFHIFSPDMHIILRMIIRDYPSYRLLYHNRNVSALTYSPNIQRIFWSFRHIHFPISLQNTQNGEVAPAIERVILQFYYANCNNKLSNNTNFQNLCCNRSLRFYLLHICLTHRPGSILCPSVPIFRQARACLVALSPETRG